LEGLRTDNSCGLKATSSLPEVVILRLIKLNSLNAISEVGTAE